MENIDTSTTAGKIAVMSAFERGEKIVSNYLFDPNSVPFNVTYPSWDWSMYTYEIADPYADLKAAHAAGKTIQFRGTMAEDAHEWVDISIPVWSLPVDCYRLKPLEFPAPPEGEAWEPLGDFTPEEYGISDGWRPFLKGERIESGDQAIYRPINIKFGLVANVEFEDFTFGQTIARGCFGRTKRPLPTPKKRVPLDRNEWIKDAPWFVRLKPKQPEDETRFSICMVTLVNCTGIYSASGGGADFWTYEDAAKLLERTQDGVTFSECSKIKGAA
jgi:hypothetical protein